MDVNITAYLANELESSDYSGSVMEKGENARSVTFNNALGEGEDLMLLGTPEKIEAAKKHFESMGMSEESLTWTDQETNAVFLQISGDIREDSEYFEQSPIDWEGYENDCNTIGAIGRGDDNQVYYYFGS